MSSELYVELDEVYACAEEINEYLQDFTNWVAPIFPIVPGCPQPEFDPAYFVDGGAGDDWTCADSLYALRKFTFIFTLFFLLT